MKILFTGGSGLFGKSFIKLIKKRSSYDIYAAYNENPIESEGALFLDITEKKRVADIVKKLNPDIIVHAAAFTSVDKCELKDKLMFGELWLML